MLGEIVRFCVELLVVQYNYVYRADYNVTLFVCIAIASNDNGMAAFHNGTVQNATVVLTSLLKLDAANTRTIDFEAVFQGQLRPAAQVRRTALYFIS